MALVLLSIVLPMVLSMDASDLILALATPMAPLLGNYYHGVVAGIGVGG